MPGIDVEGLKRRYVVDIFLFFFNKPKALNRGKLIFKIPQDLGCICGCVTSKRFSLCVGP